MATIPKLSYVVGTPANYTPGALFVGTLGTIINEDVQIFNNVTTATAPGGSAEDAVNINLLGKRRVVIVTGIYPGTDTEISGFITLMDAWVNQRFGQEYLMYTSSLNRNYRIKCLDFSFTRNITNFQVINYSMVLICG